MSRRKLSSVLVVASGALAATALVLASPTAAAGPPTVVSGTFTVADVTQTPTRYVGGNLFEYVTNTLAHSGDMTGTDTQSGDWVLHSDGSFEAKGTEVCDVCTIGSRTGSLHGIYTIKGSWFTGNYSGRLTILRGGGGLAGAHGSGIVQGNLYLQSGSYTDTFVLP